MAHITSDMSDAQIRRVLRREKKRRARIKVASRLGILILVIFMMIYLLVTGIQRIFITDTHAADIATGQDIRGTIFVDAGHGGDDPGAEAKGRLEKDDTLVMAKAIKKALEKKGFKVVMSRTEDVTVDREARGKMANEAGAGLMISCHRNKATEGQGIEMWIPSANGNADRMLGESIMFYMEKVGITANRGVRAGTLPDATDDYAENRTSNMPSVLIEFGFMSDDEDNELFDTHLNEYAAAVAKGVSKTYANLYEKD